MVGDTIFLISNLRDAVCKCFYRVGPKNVGLFLSHIRRGELPISSDRVFS